MLELEPWDPLMRRRRPFELFGEMFPLRPGFPEIRQEPLIRQPLVDILDKGKELLVSIELPGIDKRDVSLDIENNALSISAEARQAKKEEKKGYFYQERSFQKFFRRIPLPAEVAAGKSKAELKNGVLEISLPKKSPVKGTKKVKLRVG